MSDSLAAVVLAAGAGTRLRPLTRVRPKALCPVGHQPLVDHVLARVEAVTADVAVNVHHGRELLESHLAGRVHLSIEEEQALGTAGALGRLREWIDGRPTLVVNADSYTSAPLAALLDGWDGEQLRALVAGSDELEPTSRLAGLLLPWPDVSRLRARPGGLWDSTLRKALRAGRIGVVSTSERFVDCGTPASYLAANLSWSGGESVVGAGAEVAGSLERCVVWPGGVVWPGERLVDAVRVGETMTVLVR